MADPVQVRSGLARGNSALLLLVTASIFVVPVFPVAWHDLLFSTTHTAVFVMAAWSLQRARRGLLLAAAIVTALEWISYGADLPLLNALSKALIVMFFLVTVALMVAQIAASRVVNLTTILEAVNGYLLIGLAFSSVVATITLFHPEAYNFTAGAPGHSDFADHQYFAFVTFTTLGYGDIVPRAPIARSLSILAGVSGQIYVAVIIAMLVGKLSTASRPREGT